LGVVGFLLALFIGLTFLVGVARVRFRMAPVVGAVGLVGGYVVLLASVGIATSSVARCWSCGGLSPRTWVTDAALFGGMATIWGLVAIWVGASLADRLARKEPPERDTISP
jgi:hypothetical protein